MIQSFVITFYDTFSRFFDTTWIVVREGCRGSPVPLCIILMTGDCAFDKLVFVWTRTKKEPWEGPGQSGEIPEADWDLAVCKTFQSIPLMCCNMTQLEPNCAIDNKLESPSHQNKILPLSTENEALYKKLKEEEENSKHIPTEKNLVGSVSLSFPA